MIIKPKNLDIATEERIETDQRNPKLLTASRLYEEQFLREMIREMRKTINDSGLIKTGMAEKIFREKLDDQYVNVWTQNGGVGLADLIYQQIVERYGPQLGIPSTSLRSMAVNAYKRTRP